jgi:hypothetical protein
MFRALHSQFIPGKKVWLSRGLRLTSAAALLPGLRFRTPPVYGCLSLVNVLCCQVEERLTDRSLVQRNPTECRASVCDLKTSKMRQTRPE